MDASERDEITMLSAPQFQSDYRSRSTGRAFSTRTRNAPMSMPMNTLDSSENEHNLIGSTGPLRNERQTPIAQNREFIFKPRQGALRKENTQSTDGGGKYEHLLRSGPLGMCDDPYCTTCPTFYNVEGRQKQSKFYNMIRGDEKGWARRICSILHLYVLGVKNPHANVVRRADKFFTISCLFAIFLDPLFSFVLLVQRENKCMALDWPYTTTIVVLKTLTDFIYWLHNLFRFRLAYFIHDIIEGSRDIVDDPKKIARQYLLTFFGLDVFIALPLAQILTLLILPASTGAFDAIYTKIYLLLGVIIVQFFPRLIRLFSRFRPYYSIDRNVTFDIGIFSHLVGSLWYLLGLERFSQCFRDACHKSNITNCMEFIDCGHRKDYGKFRNDTAWELWKKNENASACFGGGFDFGIFKPVVNLATNKSVIARYVYSLFWGFQQISTFAGNQTPSFNVAEVVFTMFITAMGLFFFSVFIGFIQSFGQAPKKRELEMKLRSLDVAEWMNHHGLPPEIRRKIQILEDFKWDATRGINEEMLLKNFPGDLQREIRRYLFKSVQNVWIFPMLEEPIVNAIYDRLRTEVYFKDSEILFRGGLVDKMVFIIHGKMKSILEGGIAFQLSEGDVCGEELLITWFLKHSSINKDERSRIPGHRLLSDRLVRCLTNVKAFVLRVADVEELTNLFPRLLTSQRVQGAIRNGSPYWRELAARRIQVAWRYRKKRRNRADSSRPPPN